MSSALEKVLRGYLGRRNVGGRARIWKKGEKGVSECE
jgi:hypothetical protein